jgi:hypothetical protein
VSFAPLVEFGHAGAAMAAGGLVLLLRRDRRLAIFLLLIGLLDVAYSVNFSIFDIYIYYLPLYMAVAGFIAVGAAGVLSLGAALLDRLPRGAVSRGPALRYGPVTALLLALPFLQFTGHLQEVDGSQDYSSERFARAVFRQVEPDSMVLADWWTIAPLGYLKYIEGERPDVIMFAGPSIYDDDEFADLVQEDFLRGYPAVYFVEKLTYRAEFMEKHWWLVPEGPVSRVVMERPEAGSLLADIPATPIARFGDEVGLVRVEMEGGELRPGETLGFTLYWTLLPGYRGQPLEAIVLLQEEERAAGTGRIWQESNLLGHDLYPLDRWRPGEVLREQHFIYMGGAVSPGEYQLVLRVRERGKSACLSSDRPVSEDSRRDYLVARVRVGEPEALSTRERRGSAIALVRP